MSLTTPAFRRHAAIGGAGVAANLVHYPLASLDRCRAITHRVAS